eukprot:scaffold923_cov256-Pinguiococcus_pyrenoidosus.AAC.16
MTSWKNPSMAERWERIFADTSDLQLGELENWRTGELENWRTGELGRRGGSASRKLPKRREASKTSECAAGTRTTIVAPCAGKYHRQRNDGFWACAAAEKCDVAEGGGNCSSTPPKENQPTHLCAKEAGRERRSSEQRAFEPYCTELDKFTTLSRYLI